MDRLARVANLWNWLPGFRAVAETENLHEAARRMFISPSALSRTIRLLEEEIGEQLFERLGRQLQLTRLGSELLVTVRTAMRTVDDVVNVGETSSRSLRIAIRAGLTEPILMPALARVQRDHGAPAVMIAGDPDRTPIARLLCGELDVVLTCAPISDARLCVSVVRELPFSIYAHADHPVFKLGRLGVAALRDHPFVTYPVPPHPAADCWPPTLPRTIGMHVHDGRLALGACASGGWLAVLPDLMVSATAEGARSYLRRLPLDIVPPASLWAVCRHPSSRSDHAAALVAAMRECENDSAGIRAPEACVVDVRTADSDL
ncbi:MAG: LysR family transcriptional regulator [Deltaproteobacteria bacterium]|nr:LysR family transcriptional regulator [Deltaproteobacteria bacterium]